MGVEDGVMKKLMCVLPLIAMMTVAACMTSTPEAESATDQAVSGSSEMSPQPELQLSLPQSEPILIRRGASLPVPPASLTCETHFGTCRIAQCEEPREEVQNVAVVCCGDGVCTVQNFRVCGCS
jgi:hypothetical protein